MRPDQRLLHDVLGVLAPARQQAPDERQQPGPVAPHDLRERPLDEAAAQPVDGLAHVRVGQHRDHARGRHRAVALEHLHAGYFPGFLERLAARVG
jgi:hypothetical protein